MNVSSAYNLKMCRVSQKQLPVLKFIKSLTTTNVINMNMKQGKSRLSCLFRSIAYSDLKIFKIFVYRWLCDI